VKARPAKGHLTDIVRDIVGDIPEILLAYLFGSRVRGDAGPLSDFDFGVLFERVPEREELRARLGSTLAAALDTDRIDVVSLNDAAVELAYGVISEGEVLYEHDVETRVEYEAGTMSRYYDCLPVLRSQRRDILRGGDHAARVQRNREALGRTERTLEQIRDAQG
jgi:predicted nucleotidyltransferase